MKFIFLSTASILVMLSFYLSRQELHFPPRILPGSIDRLKDAEVIPFGSTGGYGGESITFDPNGEGPYTGVADGRILKWEGEEKGWRLFAVTTWNRSECVQAYAPKMEHICGRTLGLKFHNKTGDLYITDCYFGFHKVGPNGGLTTPLLTEAEGKPFKFANNLDIDEEEDVIYFSDSSTEFHRRDFWNIVLRSDFSGRLLKYDIKSKKVTQLMTGLQLANGVALNKDNSFVLVADTIRARIVRFWLKGPKAGTHDVFANLPAFPENIRRTPDGQFWVGHFSKRNKLYNWLLNKPELLMKLTKIAGTVDKVLTFMSEVRAHAIILKLSEEGQIVEVLEDSEGKTLRTITEAVEYNGHLWLALPYMPLVGRLKVE